MAQIIDRRLNGKNKSAVNRQRFLKRYSKQIKEAVSDAIAGRSIQDIEQGEKISIPTKDISEPTFRQGEGGVHQTIYTGNKEFSPGDTIPRPGGQGGGRGNKASNTGEGMDDFAFQLSKEEFLEFFFEDLALPNLIKTKLAQIKDFKQVRAGHSADGVPSNIHVVQSMRGALARRIALRSPYLKELEALEQELSGMELVAEADESRLGKLRHEIEALKGKIRRVPFLDPIDLRFHNRIAQPKPTTQAVMFCLMDISGSMDQNKKDIAKRFFILLYLFLKRTYEKIEIVFISHHTIAKEVTEEEFFYSRETGGTVVSSAIHLMQEIMHERYPSGDWNIYAAQASDGDNWNDDSPLCREMLVDSIMPYVQYYSYIEITTENPQNLWREYLKIKEACPNFAMERIETVSEIYPVFRELFKKQLV